MKTILQTGLLILWSTTAAAHSPLDTANPTDGQIVAEAPKELTLAFKGNIRLTRVTITGADLKRDLSLDGFAGFLSDYAIPLPTLGQGSFQIEWRGLGDDGHPMKGTLSFVVQQ